MSKPIVAIIGRPNVGKSTLFNRLAGKRIAVVEDTPGITRDRIYAEAEWNGREFVVVDTGGLLLDERDPLQMEVANQARAALEQADAIIFMVDGTSGLNPADKDIADVLRGSSKPIFIAVNKCDNEAREREAGEFYELGVGPVYPISALNGRMVADLLDAVVRALPERDEEPVYDEDAVKIAIVGRPNVGKSSLLNTILGEKRAIVSDIPGTTRDAIDTVCKRNDRTLVLIDTAGIRRPGKVQGTFEYYTVLRAVRAMERADVAMVVIDGSEGLCDGDKRVAGLAHEAGRACTLVVNKWDLCKGKSMKKFGEHIRKEMPFIDYAPIVFTSALTGMGVANALDAAIDAAENHALRIPTGELNRILIDAVTSKPYSRKGRDLRLRYATMVRVKPPTIALFVNDPDLVHFSYLRYLENQIRQHYSYEGTPIVFLVRAAKKERKTQ
ncbi:MAG: ribosome biogenesis GTPase Der [Armatimonadota bacterium]|nr:ribosome biogenesis GTPase Der [Armatimonadota bacterium]